MYNKYSNKKTVVDNIVFASKAEADRYRELLLLEKAGEITHLKLQPKFILQEGFKKNGKTYEKITYIADFSYTENGRSVVEDCKGLRTPVYKIKLKMFELKYPDLTIVEI